MREAREKIDLSLYVAEGKEHPYQEDPSLLPEMDKQRMLDVGIVLDGAKKRAGTFVQVDQSVVHRSILGEGVELMGTVEALQKYDWLERFLWQAVRPDADEFTAHVKSHHFNGYFIRALPGSRLIYPVQACLYLSQARLAQSVHNIIIAEEGSELHIITGCATASEQLSGLHLGISEFYIKRGARLTFTMIHSWAPEVEVRPRTGIMVEKEGVFLSNYVCLRPVRSVQMYPAARCVGENAVVRFNSVVLAPPGSYLDLGSKVMLEAKGSRAEIISRAVTTGGTVIARGYIEGKTLEVKGHLECRGLILSGEGVIHAIPELRGDLPGVDLSHEAAVGKIAEEEVEYLMARGISRDEAVAMIVRGFLRVDIEGLPPQLAAELQRAVKLAEEDAL